MKLYLFQLGLLQPMEVPIPGYLIQTDNGTNVLVDSGFPHSFIADPPEPLGPLKLQPEVREEDHITSRLASNPPTSTISSAPTSTSTTRAATNSS